jgi:hypothetical protein
MAVLYKIIHSINIKIATFSKPVVLLTLVFISLLFHFPSRFDIDKTQINIQKQKSNHLFENAFAQHGRGSQ